MQAFRREGLRRLLSATDLLRRCHHEGAASQLASVVAQRPHSQQQAQRLHACAYTAQAELAVDQAGAELQFAEAEGTDLTPKQVVQLLNKHIVGQDDAKRAVANALRMRWRRRRVSGPMKDDIVPKNILMIGPTGCGKTEIARRLAKLAGAPFVKVEATKFTEVGFHGRDVDQIIRDLVDNAIVLVRTRMRKQLREQIERAVEERILTALCGDNAMEETKNSMRQHLKNGDLDGRKIRIEIPTRLGTAAPFEAGALGLQDLMLRVEKAAGKRVEKKEVTVGEARSLIEEVESERLINGDSVVREAISTVEQDGIVFIDEIDKIVTSSEYRYGADASSEGVQRDLLPIIEGSIVPTKHGNVSTDHILFICSGAFHSCKPSDMLAELQGRLPIRVELKGLTRDDLHRILTEPEHNMIRQQTALLHTEGLELHFTDAAIMEIARVAEDVNKSVDNIGARRLHTILERIVDEVSFSAPELAAQAQARGQDMYQVVIDKEEVLSKMGDLLKKQDLSKYVL